MPKQRQQPNSTFANRSNSANISTKGAQRPAQLRLKARTFSDLMAEQQELQEDAQEEPQKYAGKYVTVGFEHEFAGMADPALHGVSHLQLGQSTTTLPYTGLPFSLETDADNEIELVNPPFLIETTAPGQPVPHPVDVDIAIRVIENRLYDIVQQFPTIQDLISMLRADPGINFNKVKANLLPHHLSHATKGEYNKDKNEIPEFDLRNIRLRPSEKHKSIMTQINFATDAATYAEIVQNNIPQGGRARQAESEEMVKEISEFLLSTKQNKAQEIFFTLLKRNLSEQMAVTAMTVVRNMQNREYFEDEKIKDSQHVGAFVELASYTSNLKDRHRIWIKDSLMSIGAGILSPDDWVYIMAVIEKALTFTVKFTPGDTLSERAAANVKAALTEIHSQISEGKTRPDNIYRPQQDVEFLAHDPKLIGARQDTYVSPDKAQMPGIWQQRLHVVETRSQGVNTLAGLQHGDWDRARSEADDHDYKNKNVPYNFGRYGYFYKPKHDAFMKNNPAAVIDDPVHGQLRNFSGNPIDQSFTALPKEPFMHYNPKLDMHFDPHTGMYWDKEKQLYFNHTIGMYFNEAERKFVSPDGQELLQHVAVGKYKSNVRDEVYNSISRIWETPGGQFLRVATNTEFSNPSKGIKYNPAQERKSLTRIGRPVTLLVDTGSRFREVVVNNGVYMHEVPFPDQKKGEPLMSLTKYKYVKILDAEYNQIAEGETIK